MEINRKVFKGNIVDHDGNKVVKDIMYEIYNIDNMLYAREIFTNSLFPLNIMVYKDKKCYPCLVDKDPLYVDFPFKVWCLDSSKTICVDWCDALDDIMVNNSIEIERYNKRFDKEKVSKILSVIPVYCFVNNFVKKYMNDLKMKNDFFDEKIDKYKELLYDENIVYESNIVSEQKVFESNFSILYRIIKIDNYYYGKEVCTGIVLPLYCGYDAPEVVITTEFDKNNRYINHEDSISIDDSIILDSVLDNYMKNFNHLDYLTSVKEMIKFKYNINKDDKLTNSNKDIVTLKNIPKGCSVVNDRELITIVGRERETKELVKNVLIGNESVILIGDAGVGKTALVENLARLINSKDKSYYLNKFIVEVNTGSLLSGTKYRGEFEEKLQRVIDFAVKYKGKVILFIDEIHTLYGLGRAEGSVIDAMNILKPYIERKDIQVIGATTKEEYNESIGMDKAFSSRFNTIKLDGLSSSVKEGIVVNYIKELEDVYNIKLDSGIQVDVLAGELVRLADRQDVRYKINSIRILKRVIRGSFNEAIYNEHDKVLLSDIIACLEITDELLVKREYIDSLRSRLGMRNNSKILRLNV